MTGRLWAVCNTAQWGDPSMNMDGGMLYLLILFAETGLELPELYLRIFFCVKALRLAAHIRANKKGMNCFIPFLTQHFILCDKYRIQFLPCQVPN